MDCCKKNRISNRGLMFFLILGLALVAALSGCTKKEEEKQSSHEAHKQMEAEEKKPLYACPMHPQITSYKPGETCPICGMDLVLVEQEESSEEGSAESAHEDHSEHEMDHSKHSDMDHSKHEMPKGRTKVKLSLKKKQMIGVKVEKIERKKLFKRIQAPGRLAFDPELYTAQSEYLEALKQWQRVKNSPVVDVRTSTQEMIRAAEVRLKILGLSEGQITNLKRKGGQSEGLLLSGKGQDNWIYADVFEVDLPYIQKGLSSEITAQFLQGKKLYGEVVSVDSVIDSQSRTAKVRIKLKTKDSHVRPESYVNVTILSPVGEHLAIPIEALMDTGRENFIFIRTSEDTFEPRLVHPVIETDDYIVVREGEVSEGEKIVIGANFMLDSESRLKAAIQGGGASSSSGHNH